MERLGSGILVRRFYDELWNTGDPATAPLILAPDFVFRGSLGSESVGVAPFLAYVRDVRAALSDYHCEILELIEQDEKAAARMRFSGRHRGVFLGHAPTGSMIEWQGAAFFRTDGHRIRDLWVLGDLDSLRKRLAGAPTA